MNLRIIREKQGFTQLKLAKKIGVSRSTVAMWETGGSQPNNDNLKDLSKLLNVSIDEILGNETGKPKGIKIPVLGRVAAGIPIEAIEEVLDWEEISPDMAANGEYFALQIKGNSMNPRIWSGDVVIVRRQSCVEDGHIGVFVVNGYDATCKRVKYTESGIMLVSLNPDFEPMFYTHDQIENEPVTTLGEVVEVRGKLK